jgi:phospholipid/cholesterol/gamma-HCH transport system ATP-binding protein
MIRLSGVEKRFGGTTVLKGIDFTAERGEIVGVVGPGGGGKTVLLKIIAGLWLADKGTAVIDGQDFAKVSDDGRSHLWERFGFLFQNYALFDFMTVGQNVAFPIEQRKPHPPADEVRRLVSERLREVDLPGTEHLFPNELSGGMKKRVALARATIAHAEIMLYDDPTAGLDPVTSSKIFALIERLHPEGGVSVVVSHDIDRMLPICHRFILLDRGAVRFRGDRAAADVSDDPMVRTFFDKGARSLSGAA